ncbi:hypothetical protein YC2023_071939 [Brassica napus]
MDISALASMKNVAKCDTWCELQNPVNHRVFERKLRPKPSGRGHVCLGVTNPEEKKLTRIPLVTTSKPGRAQLENRTSLAFELLSGEASSAMDRAQVPWKGVPERVRDPSFPDPVAQRGYVYESGCLGMQPQSGGKFCPRLNMGERSIANKYRESQRVLEIVGREADGGRRFIPVGCGTEQSGPLIDSGRGPTRIKVVT